MTQGTIDNPPPEPPALRAGRLSPRVRTLVVVIELLLAGGLAAWWLTSHSLRTSTSLWVLLFYCIPSEFIIAPLPHEPVILFFAKYHSPLVVALVSAAGTLAVEAVNYGAIRWFADLRVFRRMLAGAAVRKIVALFNRAPFLALCAAGFLPVPFYPFRFLAVAACYPWPDYLLAVLVSRVPRFFLLALAGKVLKFDLSGIAIFTVLFILLVNFPLLRRALRKKRPTRGAEDAFPGPAGPPEL